MNFHHHGFLADYSSLDSPVHRLAAGVKMFIAAAVVVTVAVFPLHALLDLGIAVGLIGIAAASRIPPFFLIKRIAMIEPIVLGVAVLALFQPGGGAIFAAMAIRSSLCVATMVLLANTTPFPELLAVLRRMHMPALLVTTIALMHRYLFVLGDEAMRMRRARASRTFTTGRGHALKSVASVIGRLFVRAHDRSERIYAAMCARGWK
jgi:cobalt/nickel transport system permease protein